MRRGVFVGFIAKKIKTATKAVFKLYSGTPPMGGEPFAV